MYRDNFSLIPLTNAILLIDYKPDKKAKLSTPSAYWANRGFCKLPKGR